MPKKQIKIADIVRIFGECEVQDERGIWIPITISDDEEKAEAT